MIFLEIFYSTTTNVAPPICQETIDIMANQWKTALGENKTVKAELKIKTDELSKSKLLNDVKDTATISLVKTVDELRDENTKSKAKNAEQKIQIHKLELKISNLQDKNTKKTTKIEKLLKQHDKSTDEICSLLTQLKQLTTKNTDLTTQLDEALNKNKEFEAKFFDNTAFCAKLQTQLSAYRPPTCDSILGEGPSSKSSKPKKTKPIPQVKLSLAPSIVVNEGIHQLGLSLNNRLSKTAAKSSTTTQTADASAIPATIPTATVIDAPITAVSAPSLAKSKIIPRKRNLVCTELVKQTKLAEAKLKNTRITNAHGSKDAKKLKKLLPG